MVVVVAGILVPLKVALCALGEPLSTTNKLPLRDPVAVGAKVTLMVQLESPARELPQVLPGELKSPLVEMPVIVTGTSLVLLNVAVCGALVVPNIWGPNERPGRERVQFEITVTGSGMPLNCGVSAGSVGPRETFAVTEGRPAGAGPLNATGKLAPSIDSGSSPVIT